MKRAAKKLSKLVPSSPFLVIFNFYFMLCFMLLFNIPSYCQGVMHSNVIAKDEQPDYILMEEGEDEGIYFIELKDPHIKFNRFMLKFNKALDSVIIKPVSQQYSAIVPRYARKRVFLVLQNLQEPLSFINKTLKLDFHGSLTSFWRFIINSTIGLGGMYDVASKMDLEHDEASFEEVMERVGFEPGDYLILPLVGPTNTRGAVALVADIFLNPLTYLLSGGDIYIYRGSDIVSVRDQYFNEINDLLYENEETYMRMKSVYQQKLARQ